MILDADFRVVTANRAFYATFQVRRRRRSAGSLFDLGNRQWNIPRLRTLLEEILPRDSVVEDFEVEHQFETIGRRTMLLNARRLRSARDQAALILLAIEDVTEARRLEAAHVALRREQTRAPRRRRRPGPRTGSSRSCRTSCARR